MSVMKTIPSRTRFLAARSKGKKALARGLVIQAIARDSNDWRIGLTATKKIGNAVTRNRARRRMRALARDHLSPLAKNGVDYVLIARHDTATANWQDMANGLQKAIRYLHRTIATDANQGAKPKAKPNAKPDLRPMTDRPSQGET